MSGEGSIPHRRTQFCLSSVLAVLALAAIRVYRTVVSPVLPPSCRYTPTCSQYAMDAIRIHGAGRGASLAIRRILRCHPWHAGGWDPVPARSEEGKGMGNGSQDASCLCSDDSTSGSFFSRVFPTEVSRIEDRGTGGFLPHGGGTAAR